MEKNNEGGLCNLSSVNTGIVNGGRLVMKAGGLQTIRTIGTLWSWTYKSRDREGAHIQNKMADAIDDL